MLGMLQITFLKKGLQKSLFILRQDPLRQCIAQLLLDIFFRYVPPADEVNLKISCKVLENIVKPKNLQNT